MIAALAPVCPAPGPIHHAGPTHSLPGMGGIWEQFFTRGCQIKTGEHRDDFNFNLLSSRCHAASWYRDKQWKYFSSHDLIVIIIRTIRITLWVPILLRLDSSRSSFILFSLPLYPHMRNSSCSRIPRCRTSHPRHRWHPPSRVWEDGDVCWLAVTGCEISGFVIVKRRARVKAAPCPGPDITLLQRNIIFITRLLIQWGCSHVRMTSEQKGFLQQTDFEKRCYHLVIESIQRIDQHHHDMTSYHKIFDGYSVGILSNEFSLRHIYSGCECEEMWKWSEETCHGTEKTGSQLWDRLPGETEIRPITWGILQRKLAPVRLAVETGACLYSLFSDKLSRGRKSPREVRDGSCSVFSVHTHWVTADL